MPAEINLGQWKMISKDNKQKKTTNKQTKNGGNMKKTSQQSNREKTRERSEVKQSDVKRWELADPRVRFG